MPPLGPKNLEIRSRNVAASEVGALLGEHPYRTAGQVWDRLNGIERWQAPNLNMRFGSEAEPIVLRMAQEALQRSTLGDTVKVRMNTRTFEHDRVRLCATPDAYLLNTRTLLELKTSWSQDRWRNGLPPDIEWQARAQMACTHRDMVVVYVFSGMEHVYIVKRQHGKERLLTQAVERFWNDHMATGIRPPDRPKAEIVYRRAK